MDLEDTDCFRITPIGMHTLTTVTLRGSHLGIRPSRPFLWDVSARKAGLQSVCVRKTASLIAGVQPGDVK